MNELMASLHLAVNKLIKSVPQIKTNGDNYKADKNEKDNLGRTHYSVYLNYTNNKDDTNFNKYMNYDHYMQKAEWRVIAVTFFNLRNIKSSKKDFLELNNDERKINDEALRDGLSLIISKAVPLIRDLYPLYIDDIDLEIEHLNNLQMRMENQKDFLTPNFLNRYYGHYGSPTTLQQHFINYLERNDDEYIKNNFDFIENNIENLKVNIAIVQEIVDIFHYIESIKECSN